MTQQKGRELLLKLQDPDDPDQYTNLAGVKTSKFNMSTSPVDTTTSDKANPGGVVQKTSVAGIRSQTFSGEGKYVKDAETKQFVEAALNGEPMNCQVCVPGLGIFTGPWIASEFEVSGELEGTMDFSISLEASDKQDFEAEA
ncbi:phage major tail protein, TP901-1 family [Flexibacterium corallicola]|uniref:phage major tail protein, TP901-1 family n=1 Tax=Flexibacterium corallicola TaxID=3037259 RepID=UPI00286EEF63|nr:phage major tail protein, TP901-1 family [Pseudovibrio sp. M1P-2-3]